MGVAIALVRGGCAWGEVLVMRCGGSLWGFGYMELDGYLLVGEEGGEGG